MKDKVLFENNEFFLLRDFPSEMEFDRHVRPEVEYKLAIEACIAAKTKIDNPELLMHIMGLQYGLDRPLKPGDILDLPDGVEFEEKYQFYCMGWCDCSEKEYHAWNVRENVKADTQKVIHIKLKQEVKTELKCASEMGVGYAPIIGRDESQYDLTWDTALTEGIVATNANIKPYTAFLRHMESKFKIQRILPEQ
jgi:hypothetical protein